MGRDWALRTTPADLVERYEREGLWTGDTLGELLATCLRDNTELEVRVWSATRPARTTAGHVFEQARRFAGGLRDRGVEPGDVIAFQLPNCVEAAVVFWGAAVLGAVLVPIVHFYGAKEVGYILRESRARVLITADRFGSLDFIATLRGLAPDLVDLDLTALVRFDAGEQTGEASDLNTPLIEFGDLLAAEPLDEPLHVDADTPALIAYTSGTTANPKGVIHTHRSIVAEIHQLGDIQPPDPRSPLVGAPVGHAIGMLAGLLLPVYRHQAIHLIDAWHPPSVLAAMIDADLTAGSGATFFLTSLLDTPGIGVEHLARMRYVGLGGSTVPESVADRAITHGISIARSYGSTEHPSITGATHDEPQQKRKSTDGHPLLGVELRIIDEQGDELPTGQAGEILSRGPDLFAGYTDQSLTAAAVDSAGWYHTGDIGVLDADGWLKITDRKNDIIIRGGENISAAEVEDVLSRLPGVAEVAVVAAPDERLGEHACAFFRMAAGPGTSAPSMDEVQTHLASSGLAKQKWPEEVQAVDDFPRTPSGKIKKFELRARE